MTKPDSTHWPIFWTGISLVLIACGCVAEETYIPEIGGDSQVHGTAALVLGWATLVDGCPAWFANPLIILVAVFMHFQMWPKAVTAASIAVGCSLTIFFFWVPFPLADKIALVLREGAWLWLAGIACVWASAIVAWRRNSELPV